MKRSLKVLLLLSLVQWSQALTIFENVDDDFSVEKNVSPPYLTCRKENGDATSKEGKTKTDSEVIELTDVEEMFAEHGRQSIWNVYKIPGGAKAEEVNYTQCTLCSFHSIKCVEDPNTFENVCNKKSAYKGIRKGAVCEKHVVNFKVNSGPSGGGNSLRKKREKEIFEESSTAINFPIGNSGLRKKRSRGSKLLQHCPMPHPMTTAGVKCKAHPKFVKCTQQCSFGYTLEGGITQNMHCNYTDGVWKPTGFKECKPFVDCTMVLTSGGSLDCRSMSVTDSPECQVECLPYEDKEAEPPQTYKCSIDGTWDPPLPFCVHPGSGLALAKAPPVRLHEDLGEN